MTLIPTIIDYFSIILLLVAGLIGALVETKLQNGKLNRWGWSIIIVLTIVSLVSIGSKYFEHDEKEKREKKETKEKQKQDSIQMSFQKLVIDSLHKSISDLQGISLQSATTLKTSIEITE